MRILSSIGIALILTLVACRSVPSNVAEAHELSKTESAAAFVLAEDILNKVEEKSAELNDIVVNKAFNDWTSHVSIVVKARDVVTQYLIDSKAEGDLIAAHKVGRKLLMDMDVGFGNITVFWEEMLSDERTVDREVFLTGFRKDIERYRVLERKFDEWISQFRIKD